ncbi:MAG: hypothetical protein HY231_11955 [Acidobacteria bacterium]|nr:hypothetical protein [Acidobacteriota bacterium]
MKRLMRIVSTIAILSLPVAAQTADQIIAKNIAARGGLKKFRAIQTLTLTGRLTGPGMNAPITVELKRPKQFRMDLLVDGKTITQVYANGTGWQASPFQHQGAPQTMKDAELKSVEDQAEIDSPLIDYRAKGHQVEALGKEEVNGTPCYKLKVTLKTGTVIYQFLDAKTFLEIREELHRTVEGKETIIEESVGNYQKFGGLLFACEFDSYTKGSPDHFILKLEKIELNQNIADALFKMPSAKPTNAK